MCLPFLCELRFTEVVSGRSDLGISAGIINVARLGRRKRLARSKERGHVRHYGQKNSARHNGCHSAPSAEVTLAAKILSTLFADRHASLRCDLMVRGIGPSAKPAISGRGRSLVSSRGTTGCSGLHTILVHNPKAKLFSIARVPRLRQPERLKKVRRKFKRS